MKITQTVIGEYQAITVLVKSYLFLILVGTILLLLPFSICTEPLSFVDTLFTATSAVCVTGLAVKDMASFSPFGQAVILCLIQLGGLGIMTFASFFLVLFGQKLSIGNRLIFKDLPLSLTHKNIFSVLKHMFIFALAFECLGAILLSVFVFSHEMPLLDNLWYSLFHSISAFCNAGFSLYATSFISLRSSIALNCIIMALIIAGGLGFIVYEELYQLVKLALTKKKRPPLSPYVKIVAITSLSLIIIGALLFFILESTNTGEGMTKTEMVLASFFQSVTTRTAGFNTVDIGSLSIPTLMVISALMFIGGAPFSCAGGVKVTTFAILVLVVKTAFMRRSNLTLFRRKISSEILYKAVTLLFISIIAILFITFLILLFENSGVSFQERRGSFLEIIFEVISAFGTVGLSMGVTSSLSAASKCLLILLMYVGRLGPLTLGVLLTAKMRQELYEYPETNVIIG
jgi:trk system potassium uptake protein TrkH